MPILSEFKIFRERWERDRERGRDRDRERLPMNSGSYVGRPPLPPGPPGGSINYIPHDRERERDRDRSWGATPRMERDRYSNDR